MAADCWGSQSPPGSGWSPYLWSAAGTTCGPRAIYGLDWRCSCRSMPVLLLCCSGLTLSINDEKTFNWWSKEFGVYRIMQTYLGQVQSMQLSAPCGAGFVQHLLILATSERERLYIRIHLQCIKAFINVQHLRWYFTGLTIWSVFSHSSHVIAFTALGWSSQTKRY